MSQISKRRLSSAGVMFEESVKDYLDTVAAQEDRTRSYIINRIVKDHAERNGIPIKAGNGKQRKVALNRR